jgi:hypothetical protein
MFVCTLLLGSASYAAAQSAKVKVVSSGQATELTHVLATRYVPAGGQAEIRILFSATDPKGLALADGFGDDRNLMRWLMESNTPAVKVTFNEGDEANFQLGTYGIGSSNYSGGGHSSGGDTTGVFRKLSLTKDKVAGELKHEAAGNYVLSGAFQTAVMTVTEAPSIKGPKVAASPQAQTLLAFARAMGKMDFKGAQPYAADDIEASMKEAKEMMGDAGLRQMIKERFGDPKVLQAMLNSPDVTLAESGDQARISLTKKTKNASGESSETESFKFVKVDGKWKMAM